MGNNNNDYMWYLTSTANMNSSIAVNNNSRNIGGSTRQVSQGSDNSDNYYGPQPRDRTLSPTNIDFDSIEPYDLWKDYTDTNSTTGDASFEPLPLNTAKQSAVEKTNRPRVAESEASAYSDNNN